MDEDSEEYSIATMEWPVLFVSVTQKETALKAADIARELGETWEDHIADHVLAEEWRKMDNYNRCMYLDMTHWDDENMWSTTYPNCWVRTVNYWALCIYGYENEPNLDKLFKRGSN